MLALYATAIGGFGLADSGILGSSINTLNTIDSQESSADFIGSKNILTAPTVQLGAPLAIDFARLSAANASWKHVNFSFLDLTIRHGTQVYKFFAKDNKKEVSFTPKTEGVYVLEILDTASGLSHSETFSAAIDLQQAKKSAGSAAQKIPVILTDKDSYELGETVKVISSNIEKYAMLSGMQANSFDKLAIEIVSDEATVRFLGKQNSTSFYTPKSIGIYAVIAKLGERVIANSTFYVSVTGGGLPGSAGHGILDIYMPKTEYRINEPVLIEFSVAVGQDYEFYIESGEDKYSFLGLISNKVSFVPKSAGNYTARLLRAGKEVAVRKFQVSAQEYQGEDSIPADIPAGDTAESQNVPSGATTRLPPFSPGQPVEILFDFRDRIERKNILDKLFRITSIESATGYVEGQESSNGLAVALEPAERNRFVMKISGTENLPDGVYAAVVVAAYGQSQAVEKIFFEISGLTDSVTVGKQEVKSELRPGELPLAPAEEEDESAIVAKFVAAKFTSEHVISTNIDFSKELEGKRSVLNDIFATSVIDTINIFVNEDPQKELFDVQLDYLGKESFALKLTKKQEVKRGLYKVILVASSGQQQIRKDLILDLDSRTENSISQLEDYGLIETKTRLDQQLASSMNGNEFKVIDKDGKGIKSRARLRGMSDGKADVDVQLTEPKVNLISVRGMDTQKSAFIKFDTASKHMPAPPGEKWEKVYAIDPAGIDAQSMAISAIAEGMYLYKCKEWDFAAQQCSGDWAKIKDLVIGQPYIVDVGPNDPAFAESGLIAVNTNKSIFLPGEAAFVAIGLLNNQGNMVCDADMALSITDPSGLVTSFDVDSGGITVSPECSYYGPTSLPDYYATYNVGGTGTYIINVTANWTQDGAPNNAIRISNFSVQSSVPFDISRITATRIFPYVPYDVNITVVAIQDYSGPVYEYVPASFAIEPSPNFDVNTVNQTKVLSWIADFSAGNSYKLSYTYDAPDISPYFYMIGPLEIGNFSEARQWEIASDDKVLQSVAMTAPATNQSILLGATFTITCTPTCTGSGANPTVTHTYQWCEDIDCSGGANTISTSSGTSDELSVANNPESNACNQAVSDTITARNVGTVYIRCSSTANAVTKTSSPTIVVNVSGDVGPYLSSSQTPNPAKNTTSIYQNTAVLFNATWEDDYGLIGWKFSWNNSGSWVNVTSQSFTGLINVSNITLTVTAAEGSIIGWLFYANDTANQTSNSGISTFTVASTTDTIAPSITNFRISPNVTVSGGIVYINATITDNYGVNGAYAEIQFPNTSKFNYSMSNSGSSYYYAHTTDVGGNFSVILYAVDGNSNYNITANDRKYFNVTSYIFTNTFYYAPGETVTVKGIGFSSNNNVTLNILDNTWQSASGYPDTTVQTNRTGGFTTTWQIPTSSTSIRSGNYTINATDNKLSWLRNTTGMAVVLKPYVAIENDDDGTGSVLYEVNNSDDVPAVVNSAGGSEDYLEMNWSNGFSGLYVINKVEVLIQHYASAAETMYIQWWDGSAYQSVCTIATTTTEQFSNCTISGIDTIAEANSISLRYTDNNGAAARDMSVDFIYMLINYSLDTNTHVIIQKPSRPKNFGNFTDTGNNHAYFGGDSARPPVSIASGQELTSSDYSMLISSDNQKFSSINETVGSVAYHVFNFRVPETNATLSEFRVVYEGFASRGTSAQERAVGYSVFLWNYTASSYSLIQNTSWSTLGTDVVFNRSFANPTYFINATGDVSLLVEAMNATGAGVGEGRSNLTTDYVALELTLHPLLSGIQIINFTATDGDTISACNYRYRNGTDTLGHIFMNNTVGYDWINYSDTNDYGDGFYNIDANCTDSLGNYNASETIYALIDNTNPTVTLNSPVNLANYTTSSVTLSWTASDDQPGNLKCDILINGAKNTSHPIVSRNGVAQEYSLSGLNDGWYIWNVNCSDLIGNYDAATERNFSVDTSRPTVQLNWPDIDYSTASSSITFNYTPSDSTTGLANCTLVLDTAANFTNSTITNNQPNFFSIFGISGGKHNWSVNCTDYAGFTGNSTTRNFTLDAGGPVVVLNYPVSLNITSGNVQFNFTATDDTDGVVDCNLTLDSVVNNTALILATSGANTLYTITGLNDGDHVWNVTCWDDANNPGAASNESFTVDKPPRVTLNFPIDFNATNMTLIPFNYTPSDAYDVANCTLYLDGAFNATNYSITNGEPNFFNISALLEGNHYWQVNCSDSRGSVGNSTFENFTVDYSKMSINLSAPPNGTLFQSSSITFNFTATDNLDPGLSCYITINNVIEASGIAATSGSVSTTLVPGLTNGYKYWNVTCQDDAGNQNTSLTWEFNISSPTTVNLTSPANNYFQSLPNITLYYTANSSNAMANCSLYINNALNQTNATLLNTTGGQNNFTLGDLGDKQYNWSVSCIDITALAGSSERRIFYIDSAAPEIALNFPSNNTNHTAVNISFNFTVSDLLSTNFSCNITVDGNRNNSQNIIAYNNIPAEHNISNFNEGFHQWNVSCSDLANNGNSSATYIYYIRAPPRVSLANPLQNYTTPSQDINFSYIPYDAFGIFNCSIYIDDILNLTNDSIITNNSNYFNITGINEGVHNWTVRCTDYDYSVGNSSARNFTVDMTGPNVSLSYPAPGAIFPQGTNVTFNFSAVDNFDNILKCNLSLDGIVNVSGISAQASQNTSVTVYGLNSSTHFWNVTCEDNAGLTGASATRNLTLQEVPEIYLASPLTGDGFTDPNVTMSYQVFSGYDLLSCGLIVNGETNQTNTSNVQLGGPLSYFNLTNLTEGRYNWTVNCTNVNGITGTATEESFDIDNRTPLLSLVSPSNNSVNYLSYMDFKFNVTDNVDANLSCNLSVDGTINLSNFGATSNTTTTKTVNDFIEGYHYWNVTCWDNTGFTNESPTWQFYQNFSPSLTLDFPDDGYFTRLTSLDFNFTPLDNDASLLECRLNIDNTQNGSTFITPASGAQLTRTVNDFNEGIHNWTANCTDNDLNVAAPAWRTFYIDLTGPGIYLHTPNGTSYSFDEVIFNYTAIDNFGTNLSCNLTVNNTLRSQGMSATSNQYYNLTVANFTDGRLYWNVSCTDQAGNSGSSTLFNFSMQVPPTVILGHPPNNTRASDTNYSFNFTPNDNSYNISSCTLVLNDIANNTNSTLGYGLENLVSGDYLVHGSYDWTVNCTDHAGNIGTNTTAKRFYVDLLGPGFAMTTPYDGETFNYDDIYFNFTIFEQFGFNNTVNCNLTLDDIVNRSVSSYPGTPNAVEIGNISQGDHNWTLVCWDDLNNTNTSSTLSFIVNAPDLVITPGNITFNNTNPDINDSILINATIYNVGGIEADNFDVYFFDRSTFLGIASVATLASGTSTTVNATWNITTGFRSITVNVSYAGVELNYTNNNATNNLTLLYPRITDPVNSTWSRITSNNLNIKVNDYLNNSLNYTVYLDNAPNSTFEFTDGLESVYIANLSEGKHTFIVEALAPRADVEGIDIGLTRRKNSSLFALNVDLTNATISWETANNSWHSDFSPEVWFNITDNLASLINYTVYQNGSYYVQNSTSNGTSIHVNLSTPSQGPWEIIIEAADLAGNKKNSTFLRVNIDTNPPFPNITTANNTNSSDITPLIEFNITDNLAPTLNYTFYIDFMAVSTNGTVSNGAAGANSLTSLADGYHNITLEAKDLAGNRQNSSYITIFIDSTAPVITIQSPTDGNAFGYIIDLLASITDAGTGLDTASYALLNDSGSIYQAGSLNATGNFDAWWNSTINVTEAADYIWVMFNVTANDTLGNRANASVRFIVDNRKPSIVFYAPDGTDYRDDFYLDMRIQNRNLTVSAYNITNSTFERMANNSNMSIGQQYYNWSDLISIPVATWPEGVYNVSVYAVDSVGNNRTSYNYFRIDRTPPSVILYEPIAFYNTSSQSVYFNFSANDTFDAQMICNLTVNGAIVAQDIQANNGTYANVTVNGLAQGPKMWNVTCQDNAGNNFTSESRNFTIDLTGPGMLMNSPVNGSWSSATIIDFYFTPSDNLLEVESCTLIINSTANVTNSTISMGQQNQFQQAFPEGSYTWSVNCTDDVGNEGTNSTQWQFYVDSSAPNPVITYSNNTWLSSIYPDITYTISDNLDTLLNWTFYVNGTANISGNISNGGSGSQLVGPMAEEDYLIILGAFDNANNTRNSSFIVVHIDTTSPNVTLLAPANNSNLSNTYTTFNFTSADNRAAQLYCNLTIDNAINVSGIIINSTLNYSQYVSGFNSGLHNWSVSCRDNASNTGTSHTFYFNVTPPDLIITTNNITFNESSFVEDKPFIVEANVWNIGEGAANNFTIGFYLGDPDNGGTQLGNSHLASLQPGENITVNTTVTLDIGDFSIFVQVDRSNLVSEEIETNNKANRTGNVGAYQIIYGNLSGDLVLSLNASKIFRWDFSNSTSGTVFAIDSDSQVVWSSLKALGINSTDENSTNDFYELDSGLLMGNLTDSINVTWTDHGIPLNRTNLTIFGKTVINVPLVNTTNTSVFSTGILWDSTDAPAAEYNGTQDVIFIAPINKAQPGRYGTYDFEMRIPARLRQYIQPDLDTSVTVYVELR
ncbi:hypothetical protein J4227_07425 [Candidatus Woesearchaeota archaeon]|nr:hypothetical protein [Candidatus Woesearchaeota archaeon]